jgi:hypothetical protein
MAFVLDGFFIQRNELHSDKVWLFKEMHPTGKERKRRWTPDARIQRCTIGKVDIRKRKRRTKKRKGRRS